MSRTSRTDHDGDGARAAETERGSTSKRGGDGASAPAHPDRAGRLQRAGGNQALQRLATGGSAGLRAAERQARELGAGSTASERDSAEPAEAGRSPRMDTPPAIGQASARGGLPGVESGPDSVLVRSRLRALERDGGRPLPSGATSAVERAFGLEPRGLRVHTGRDAAGLLSGLDARALTAGRHLAFAPGAYRPGTPAGDALVVHEATHAVQQASAGRVAVQRESRADRIESEVGFFGAYWEYDQLLDFLAGLSDEDFNDTVMDLVGTGTLNELLVSYIPGGLARHWRVPRFAELLGNKGTEATRDAAFDQVPILRGDVESQLTAYGKAHVGNLGSRGQLSASRRQTLESNLVSSDPGEAFTGQAVRGRKASARSVGPTTAYNLWQQERSTGEADPTMVANTVGQPVSAITNNQGDIPENVFKYHRIPGYEMLFEYSNPLKAAPTNNLGQYLRSELSATEREQQAELLFGQEIATSFPDVYEGSRPTRLQVVRAAATEHDLEPELVAAIILAEQRDQSAREDAAKHTAALAGKEVSVGLGQVRPSTVADYDLFADLLAPAGSGGREGVEDRLYQLLVSEEFNIFAVARYVREVADIGATDPASAAYVNNLGWTSVTNLSLFAQHSKHWTDQHIRLLGSEYTSTPFSGDDSGGWGWFVLEAYRDVNRAGIF